MANQNESSVADQHADRRRVARAVVLLADNRAVTLVVSLVFTLGMLFNYILPLNSLLYTTGIRGEDCGQMIWNIWFVNEAITSGHSPFSTNLIYYPLGASLAHHTLAAGFFPISFLVKLLSGNDPMYPVYAYKVIILISVALIFWLSYLTLRELGLTGWAALIAATGYAFSDFYTLHILHINHLAGFFIPLTTLFLIRAYKRPASLNLLLAALAAGVSVYFTEFTIYICLAAFFFVLVAALSRLGRRELALKVKKAGLRRLLTATIVLVAIVAPFAIILFKDKVRRPPPSDSSYYSANLAGFFVPGQEPDESGRPGHLTTPLYGRVFASLNSRITVGVGGFEIFVGFPLLLFSVIGLVKFRSGVLRICAVLALGFFLLSLGPTLKIFGTETWVPLPYSLLMRIPPFDTGRTPVRFVVIGLFLLMIVAAFGLAWMETLLSERMGRRWSWFAMLLVFAWTTAEVYSGTPRRPSFVAPHNLRQRVTGPVFNIPLRAVDGYAALLQVFHRQPIATGYLARDSFERRKRFEQLKEVYDRGGPEFCDRIAELGFQNIVVTRGAVLVPLKLSTCRLPVIDLRAEIMWEPDDSASPKSDVPQFPSLAFGQQVDFSAAAADQYLWYGWSGREATARWTDRGSAALVFSLEAERTSLLRLEMAPFVAPPRLAMQTMQVKINGQPVASLKLSNPQYAEYSVQLPGNLLRKENVLTFELPDAQSPKSIGISEDARLLGISVRSMRVTEPRAIATGSNDER